MQTGAVTLELESAVAGQVAFETVKEKVRGELDMYVDLPEFSDLFELVVNIWRQQEPLHSAVDRVWEQVRRPEAAATSLASFCCGEQVAAPYPSLQYRHDHAGVQENAH